MSTLARLADSPAGKLAGNITRPPAAHVPVWVVVIAVALVVLGVAIAVYQKCLRGRQLARRRIRGARQAYFAAYRQYAGGPGFIPDLNMTMDGRELRRQRRYERDPAAQTREDLQVLAGTGPVALPADGRRS